MSELSGYRPSNHYEDVRRACPDMSVDKLSAIYIDELQRHSKRRRMSERRSVHEILADNEPWVRWLPMVGNYESPAWAQFYILADRVERIQPSADTFVNSMTIRPSMTASGKNIEARSFASCINNVARSLKLQIYALAQMRCEYIYCHSCQLCVKVFFVLLTSYFKSRKRGFITRKFLIQ